MLNNEFTVTMPAAEATENNIQMVETSLQMEELESLVAPNIVWGD
jgi:hypothetical protein